MKYHTTILRVAVTVALLASIAVAPRARAAETGEAFDEASRKVLNDELFATEREDFEEPPWLRAEEPTPARRPGPPAHRERGHLSIAAGMVMGTEEHGDVKDFTGEGGAGTEVRLAWGRPRGWNMALSLSQVDENLFSSVDGVPTTATRYLLGMERSWKIGRAVVMSTSGGLAYSAIDVDDPNTDRDIAGVGGYVELRLSIPVGDRICVGMGGRALAWQGEDGFGNTGEELSTIIAANVGMTF